MACKLSGRSVLDEKCPQVDSECPVLMISSTWLAGTVDYPLEDPVWAGEFHGGGGPNPLH